MTEMFLSFRLFTFFDLGHVDINGLVYFRLGLGQFLYEWREKKKSGGE